MFNEVNTLTAETRAVIREATVADLPQLEPGAREFFASSQFLSGFDLQCFIATWTMFLRDHSGIILLLESNGEILGALGGLVSHDPNNGSLVASELFWFVRPGARGNGLKLLQRFEEWARARNCSQLQMVHLMDSMPDRLARFYARHGFQAAEIHYVKALA